MDTHTHTYIHECIQTHISAYANIDLPLGFAFALQGVCVAVKSTARGAVLSRLNCALLGEQHTPPDRLGCMLQIGTDDRCVRVWSIDGYACMCVEGVSLYGSREGSEQLCTQTMHIHSMYCIRIH